MLLFYTMRFILSWKTGRGKEELTEEGVVRGSKEICVSL